MTSDPHISHRRSIRLQGYDYSQPGAYFVTIVTRDRNPLFGEIINSIIHLTKMGEMIEHEWLRLEKRFSNLGLDVWIIMPNHVHGIIRLDYSGRGTGDSHEIIADHDIPRALTVERYGKPTSASIPTIIRSYKSSTTQFLHRMVGNTASGLWQRNYYEHVIRNENELTHIREYIQANPYRWTDDEEYVV